jgi:hypothetical protein
LQFRQLTDQERRELPTEVRRNHEAIARHNEEWESGECHPLQPDVRGNLADVHAGGRRARWLGPHQQPQDTISRLMWLLLEMRGKR